MEFVISVCEAKRKGSEALVRVAPAAAAAAGAASADEEGSLNHQGSSSSSSSACSWSCFLEFLCSLHLEGLDSEEQNLSKVTKEDEAEAAKLTAASSRQGGAGGGGILSAVDMAQV